MLWRIWSVFPTISKLNSLGQRNLKKLQVFLKRAQSFMLEAPIHFHKQINLNENVCFLYIWIIALYSFMSMSIVNTKIHSLKRILLVGVLEGGVRERGREKYYYIWYYSGYYSGTWHGGRSWIIKFRIIAVIQCVSLLN